MREYAIANPYTFVRTGKGAGFIVVGFLFLANLLERIFYARLIKGYALEGNGLASAASSKQQKNPEDAERDYFTHSVYSFR
jgi:hypothetical protein